MSTQAQLTCRRLPAILAWACALVLCAGSASVDAQTAEPKSAPPRPRSVVPT